MLILLDRATQRCMADPAAVADPASLVNEGVTAGGAGAGNSEILDGNVKHGYPFMEDYEDEVAVFMDVDGCLDGGGSSIDVDRHHPRRSGSGIPFQQEDSVSGPIPLGYPGRRPSPRYDLVYQKIRPRPNPDWMYLGGMGSGGLSRAHSAATFDSAIDRVESVGTGRGGSHLWKGGGGGGVVVPAASRSGTLRDAGRRSLASTANTSSTRFLGESISSPSVRFDHPGESWNRRSTTTGVQSRTHGRTLPGSEWVAVRSKRNNQTFYYHVRTHRVTWIKPWRDELPAPLPPPPPDPPVCRHPECRGASHGRHGICLRFGPQIANDEDLRIRANKHGVAALEFGQALIMHGPKIILAKILFGNAEHCFQMWRAGAKEKKRLREELHFRSAAKIQAQYRRCLVEAQMRERIREYKRRLKCADFPDIRAQMKQLLTYELPENTKEWFLSWSASYMQRSLGRAKPPKRRPTGCANDACQQPPLCVQTNGFCVRCNYLVRFPDKANLMLVRDEMENQLKKKKYRGERLLRPKEKFTLF